MVSKKSLVLFLLLAVPLLRGRAQLPVSIGNTYLETFQNKCGSLEKSQIWSIVPGNENYMFFASNDGLGVYDGVRWEVYNPSSGSIIRSLYFDSKTNTLYTGSVNEFGKWTQNKYGKFQYTPIWINKAKIMSIEFWRVCSPVNNGRNIYAQSHQMILKYNINTQATDTIKAVDNFSYMHIVSGDVWVQAKDFLYRIDSDKKLHKIISVNDRVIHIVRRDSDKKTILFLEHKGVFILSDDYTKMTPLNARSNAVLGKAKIFTAKENRKGQYLVGTTSSGLYILDENGNIVENVGGNNGLPTSTVLSVNIDNYENIWMGLDAGVASLDMESKETYYSPKLSVGIIRSIVPVQNDIYMGSNQGVFKLTSQGNFYKIEGTSGSVWSMYNIGGELVYNHDMGLFCLNGETPVRIKEGGATTLVQSFTNPSYYVGTDYYGLSLYKITDGKPSFLSKIKAYEGASRHILFDRYGYLWLMIPKDGFVRLTLSKDMASIEEIKKYNMALSENKNYFLMTLLDDHIVFYDGVTPYMYNVQTQELEPDKDLSEIFHLSGTNLVSLNQFDNVFWYQTPGDIGYIVRQGDKLEKYSGIFTHIYNKRVSPFVTKLDLNTYSIGYQNGIAFSQLSRTASNHLKIRLVEAYGVGSPVYYDFDQKQFELPNNKKIINIYPVNLNADHVIEYRILEMDSVWMKETVDNYLTLTQLESGSYTIQLRNANDLDGKPAQISIKIDVPWYIGSPMIFVYIVILTCIIFLISLFYKRKAEKEKKRIERIKQAQVDKLEKENLIQSQLILELEKDKLEIELQEKDKRLAFITMNGVKRNNLMNELKQEIQEAEKYEQSKEAKQTIKKVIKKIEDELNNNEDWEIFEKYFNVVFGGLLERLAIKYPQLSQGDLKLLAYLKLNLNGKEIANLLNISYRSVEMAKYRLRKKLNLEANDNFSFILNENN
jgi:DNA-binding CsgD family transcriptional regulator